MRISTCTTASAPSHVVGMPGYWYALSVGCFCGSAVRVGRSATAAAVIEIPFWRLRPGKAECSTRAELLRGVAGQPGSGRDEQRYRRVLETCRKTSDRYRASS